MALVTSFEPNAKGRQSVHRPTRCFYAIVEGLGGARYLQLDTVGSEDREVPEKVSQSIQFDRQAAGQLLQILRQAFPDLAGSEEASNPTQAESTDDDWDIEGRILLKLHRSKERARTLVRRKKQVVLKATGQLRCEACDFIFSDFYGPIGAGFAECHHRVPLAELDGETTTRLAELAIVCANCHRMLHRQPFYSVEELRELVVKKRVVGGEA